MNLKHRSVFICRAERNIEHVIYGHTIDWHMTPLDYSIDNWKYVIMQSWMGSRPHQLNTQVIRFSDVDRELRFKPGTAEKYIERAAQRWRYTVERKGNNTILFKKEERLETKRRGWLDNY